MEGEIDQVVEERTKKLKNFLRDGWSWITYILLAGIVYLSVRIRTRNLNGLRDVTTGGWTLGPDLDPFLFLRWAKYIVENGSLFVIDTMRNVPSGYPVADELLLHPYMMAWLHNLLSVFGLTESVEYSAVIYPVIMFALTVIVFFFLARKIFLKSMGERYANIIGLGSALFLSILPAILPRTIAGIPEKESAAFLFLFMAFYFFLVGWMAKSNTKSIIGALLAGVSTAGMAHIWGGFGYIYLVLSVAVMIAFLFGMMNNRKILAFAIWLITSFLLIIPLSERYSLATLSSITTGSSVLILLTIIVHKVMHGIKLKRYYSLKYINKIPRPLVSLLITMVIGGIFATLIFGPSFIPNRISEVVQNLVKPAESRLIQTVAENRQPYFNEWANNFGPPLAIMNNMPIVFWLFFVGSIYLFNQMVHMFKNRERLALTSAYAIFLVSIIFSRYKADSVLNGTNGISLLVYAFGFIILLGTFGYYYWVYNLKDRDKLKEIDFGILLLMAFFFLGIVSARGAVRLIMMLVPTAAILVSYFGVATTRSAIRKGGAMKWTIAGVVVLLLLIAAFAPGNGLYDRSNGQASVHVPSSYTQQWQRAMGWVRENTPEDAVFGHWWDYGYWVQSIGERATMLDGGNARGYWNYLMGRHVLTGKSEAEAMEVLYAHDVTHFLIDSTDIGKYGAYSTIGSDENWDRRAFIGNFFRDEGQTQETKDLITSIYTGGANLDDDIIINVGGSEKLLPSGNSGIGAIIIKQNSDQSFAQPEIILVSGGTQYNLPLRYLYVNGVEADFGLDAENTIEGAAYLFPEVTQTQVEEMGAAFYLSPRHLDALWVRLYLLGEGDRFNLVHSEPSPLHTSLSAQGIDLFEIAYFGGVQGPIKIWEIQYTGDEEVNPEYAQNYFPEYLLGRS